MFDKTEGQPKKVGEHKMLNGDIQEVFSVTINNHGSNGDWSGSRTFIKKNK